MMLVCQNICVTEVQLNKTLCCPHFNTRNWSSDSICSSKVRQKFYDFILIHFLGCLFPVFFFLMCPYYSAVEHYYNIRKQNMPYLKVFKTFLTPRDKSYLGSQVLLINRLCFGGVTPPAGGGSAVA